MCTNNIPELFFLKTRMTRESTHSNLTEHSTCSQWQGACLVHMRLWVQCLATKRNHKFEYAYIKFRSRFFSFNISMIKKGNKGRYKNSQGLTAPIFQDDDD